MEHNAKQKISITWFWKLLGSINCMVGGIYKPLVQITLKCKLVWKLTAIYFNLDCGIHCGATKSWKRSH